MAALLMTPVMNSSTNNTFAGGKSSLQSTKRRPHILTKISAAVKRGRDSLKKQNPRHYQLGSLPPPRWNGHGHNTVIVEEEESNSESGDVGIGSLAIDELYDLDASVLSGGELPELPELSDLDISGLSEFIEAFTPKTNMIRRS
ncbi:hypothetical protein E0Z10_g1885 [Xylaria hypoxylon]|uniref:Uncharacterized protein n=1 Tax=Xylaria hypoxylon TaxID=37992 RepID=A0A4Z0Z5V0_9PEZI|nr:hypothetical protein E0Z10_g1885 [Xylaria hypoxylon]